MCLRAAASGVPGTEVHVERRNGLLERPSGGVRAFFRPRDLLGQVSELALGAAWRSLETEADKDPCLSFRR